MLIFLSTFVLAVVLQPPHAADLPSILPGVLFWDDSQVLGTCIVLFGLVYLLLYWSIVRFKTPRLLVIRRS